MNTNKATFAVPCFIHLGDYYTDIKGIERVKVGNVEESAGNPVNADIGDHGEVVTLEFDPTRISYRVILSHFWTQHEPAALTDGTYATIIFTYGKEQYEEARASKENLQKRLGKDVVTQVLPIESFFPPAGYHEKYIDMKQPLHYKTSCRS